jgi:phosphatidylglycerophosphatase A
MKKQKFTISWIIATWFGSGLIPIAPGTWGSLAAFPFAYIISVSSGPYVLIIGTVALFFIGMQASNKVEKSTRKKDPGFIVVDEVVGQWIALLPKELGTATIFQTGGGSLIENIPAKLIVTHQKARRVNSVRNRDCYCN